MLELNDLLIKAGYDPAQVLVMRHRPIEPEMRRVLPELAENRPELFNAYQQTQRERAENALAKARYLASFIGLNPGTATWIGLYENKGTTPMTREAFRNRPALRELSRYGSITFQKRDKREIIQHFDLERLELANDWLGRMTIGWHAERAWFRWADRNIFPVLEVSDHSRFTEQHVHTKA